MKKKFLVSYDYGMGAVWAIIKARSREEILKKYPPLQVHDKRPPWMSWFLYKRIEFKDTYDIDDEPRGWLAKIEI